MSTLPTEFQRPRADRIRVTRDGLVVDLADGRTIITPLSWYPRLHSATPAERRNWRLIAAGEGIHWPDLDEDISTEGLLAGSRSGESQTSFRAGSTALCGGGLTARCSERRARADAREPWLRGVPAAAERVFVSQT